MSQPAMTDAEKAAAFDVLALALTNRWHDGSWSWWCRVPCGGPTRVTRTEAVVDLVEWAERMAQRRPNRIARVPLVMVGN